MPSYSRTKRGKTVIRVVFFWHAAVVSIYQSFFEYIAEVPEIDLTVVTPERFKVGEQVIPAFMESTNYQVIALPAPFAARGRQNLYFYRKRLLPFLRHLNPDIVHLYEEPESMVTLQILRAVAKLPKKPKTVMVSWRNLENYYKELWRPWQFQRYWYPVLTQWSLKRIDALCVGTKEGEQIFRKLGYSGPIIYLPHVVKTKNFYPKTPEERQHIRTRYNLPRDEPIIGYVGRLYPLKGVDLLLQALKKIEHLRWTAVIVGDGRSREELELLTSSLQLTERVLFLGEKPPEEIPNIMNALDILVLPSRKTNEGLEQFGRVLIEAMACKTCVVGSDSGGIPTVIGNAGLIFQENNAVELAECLASLITNPEKRMELAEAGYERVHLSFTDKVLAQRLVELYFRLANVPSPSALNSEK